MPELKDTKRSLFDHVFEGIFSSALNDPEIEDLVGKLEKEELLGRHGQHDQASGDRGRGINYLI